MKPIIAGILILVLFSIIEADSDKHFFISPGIKIGYAFGKNGGFTLGFETSAGLNDNDLMSGLVYGISHVFNGTSNANIYLEGEYGSLLFGAAAGLVYNFHLSTINPSLRAFVGAFGYLSYRHTFGQIPDEAALIIKCPICPTCEFGD